MTLKETHRNAREAIWRSLDTFRGKSAIGRDSVHLVVIMLLYSKYLPNSKDKIIGFFDIINTLDEVSSFDLIINELKNVTGLKIDYLFDAGDILKGKNNSDPYSLMRTIDQLRIELLPAAKLIAKGNHEDIKQVISFFKGYDENFNSSFGPVIAFNNSALEISSKFFDAISKTSRHINCLYKMGMVSASHFANSRNVFVYDRKNVLQDIFEKCLISLYGQPFKLLGKFEQSGLTFAAPAFGIRVKEGYFHIDDYAPFEEDQESKLIKDIHSKLIYLAHLNTNETTIAITNLGTLWTKTNGINYFRKIIIENNWLDAVIKLPTNIYSGSSIPCALLILKKGRSKKDKVQFIDFSDCKKDEGVKRGILVIPPEEINSLIKLYIQKKKSSISISVETNKILSNNYDLNTSRYLISEEAQKVFEIFKTRDSLTLDSLVNFVRSIPIRTSKENDSSFGGEINEIMFSDINQVGEIINTTKKIKVSKEFLSKSNIPFVKKGDLIISIKGSLGKIGVISRDLPDTIPGTSFCILRPREKSLIDIQFILQYLRSEIGQKMFSNYGRGNFIDFLSINDLKNIEIPIPTLEEQKDAKKILKRSRDLVDSIQKMQAELDACRNNGWLQIDKDSKEVKQ
tara:strand:+ start:339 stop:2219 length:1881 start_codon:yes stop_codon:yes gene_type:complete